MTNPAPASEVVAHMVYFTLREPTPAAQKKLVEDCRRYLKEIPGIVFFAVGPRIADLARPVNVQDFHVGLHVIFNSREAHDRYQTDERHQRFIAENKGGWERIRVFDCAAS